MKDEIIDEVRRVRDELAARYDYDVRRIFEALQESEAQSGREYVSLVPQKPPDETPAAGQQPL